MSADFDTKLVYDARLKDISDKLDFAVRKGGADVTWQKFRANSQSSSSMNFSVTPPSESVVVDRRMFIKSKVRFDIDISGGVPAGTSVFDYGLNQGFQSFPLNRLFDTVTLSVNNVSASVNQSNVLPALLRMIDQRTLQEYEGLTPTFLDNYGQKDFTDAVAAANNNPIGGSQVAGYDSLLQPRGAHPITFIALTNNGVRRLAGDVLIDAAFFQSANVAHAFKIELEAEFTEPLFVSPMLFASPKFNHSGYLGINNFQLVMNIDSSMKRFWSGKTPVTNAPLVVDDRYKLTLVSDAGGPFQDAELLLNFITAPMPLVLPPKISLPYSSYTSYITSSGALVAGASDPRTISSIQLEVVPDKLFIYARRKLSNQRFVDADTFASISRVSVTFGNKSGLLSNANQQQLYKLSRKNGSKVDWYGFQGYDQKYDAGSAATIAAGKLKIPQLPSQRVN
jgi:hypothetical protein